MVPDQGPEPGDNGQQVRIVYDGDCPFCRNYVQMLRLRQNGYQVELVNARDAPDDIATLTSQGLDINEGMAVWHQSRLYFGADAMHILSLLTQADQATSWMMKHVFRHPRLAALLYPVLKLGRRATLALLGVKLI